MPTLAEKWDPKVSKVLTTKSVVGGLTNQNYDFNPGVNSVNIQTITAIDLVDYDETAGLQRFGQANNVETTVQTFSLSETFAFNGIIDSLENSKRLNVVTPAKFLANQLDVKVIPYVDTYVLGVMNTAANTAGNDAIVTAGASSASNAWQNFLTLRAHSIDSNGPMTGYTAVCTSTFYNYLKESSFVTDSDLGQQMLSKGFIGNVDGTPVKIATSAVMPTNCDLIITHPLATTFAMVLKKFDTFTKIWGVAGAGVQAMELFDAFVDTNKVDLITEHKTA